MDRNAIKKYAIWARRELIEKVSQKALQYGIEEGKELDPKLESINGILLSDDEKKQRQALISKINENGYKQVMEEVAYTWFNRFIALRFMEVNGYLPSHVRVFTDETGEFKPQIMSEALHLELKGIDMEKVYDLKNDNRDDELFKYLLITQCNDLSEILPKMFQKISDYTELLLPDYLLREGSFIERMVIQGTSDSIPESDWTDQVQIIGWLYQYYNSEPKDKVFADLKKNIKITKENIPAATQLFTPDWVVHYMVENSLGRLWLEGHPNGDLKSEWKYYLDEAVQEEEVQRQLEEIRKEYASLEPKEIRVIDPCSGSGHILCVLFDVLVRIYEDYGHTAREAATSIIQNNIWGLDIDERAAQLSYFTVMMKARQYDRRFLSKKDEKGNPDIPQPHVYVIEESNSIDSSCVERFVDGRAELKSAIETLMNNMQDAKEYGSIINVTPVDFDALFTRFEELRNMDVPDIFTYRAIDELLPLVEVNHALAQKYHAVVTNPPYMEISSGSKKLVDYVNKNYIGGKTDMFAAFIERAADFALKQGFVGMITQPSLSSLVSFERLRRKLFTEKTFSSVLHMGRGIFGIDFGSFSFVYRNSHVKNYAGRYFKLYERTFQFINPEDICQIYLNASRNPLYKVDFEKYDTSSGVESISTENGTQIAYVAKQDQFMLVPGIPFAYTMSDAMINAYSMGVLGESFVTREGMATAGNDDFLRMWYEVDIQRIGFDYPNAESAEESKKKWFPYNKGGDYRKWYGNNDYVVDWENDGFRIRNNKDAKTGRIRSHNYNGEYAFRKGLTWSSISAGDISIRWSERGFLFDSKGAKGFAGSDKELYALLGFLNSTTAMRYLKVISPTMDFKVGDIIQLPLNKEIFNDERLQELVRRNIEILRNNWDAKETSWDFTGFSFNRESSLQSDFEAIAQKQAELRRELKENEEKINTIIANIYGLEDTKSDVPDEKLSMQQQTNEELAKDFISYAVGCMFGRYSLDIQGIAYAGGEWDATKYKTFQPDVDAIIPICDDEYFDDDIVGQFVKLITNIYGASKLEDNLQFIANALGGKGSSRDVIRNYFTNMFYLDHCNNYSITGSGKRPIYWLFDSGKKNGFKCLIYMHRYQPDTIARIRTDYVHEQQARYRTAIEEIEKRIESVSGSDKIKLEKKLNTLRAQDDEIHSYEEKIHHLADQMISIDLDDGVKHNYELFKDVLAKIK